MLLSRSIAALAAASAAGASAATFQWVNAAGAWFVFKGPVAA